MMAELFQTCKNICGKPPRWLKVHEWWAFDEHVPVRYRMRTKLFSIVWLFDHLHKWSEMNKASI